MIITNLLVANAMFGQTVGDYKSNQNGDWTTLSSWLRWNGSSWSQPSAGQGYPGQNTGTGSVLIQTGNTIAMGTANLTTTAIGVLTISGELILNGGSDGGIFTINTQSIVVTADITPYANIDFANKVTLALPTNATIQVGTGGLPTPGNGTCNNNIEISIGGNVLAYCTGTGSPAASYTFAELINNGGYNVIKASSTPSPNCGTASTLTATATPSTGATINWYTVPIGGTSVATGTTYTPVISNSATFYVEADYSGYTTPRKAVVATVNPLPVAATLVSNSPICSGSDAVFTITGTAGNTVTYIGSASGTAMIGAGGTVNVTISAVTSSTTLNITNVSNGTCSQALTATATVTVNASPTASPTVIVTKPTCVLQTGTLTITAVAGETYSFDNGSYSSSLIYSGLVQGSSHTVSAKSASGCISDPVSVVIDPLDTNIWNGSGWLNGLPTANQNIEFKGNYAIAADITACSCTVTSGAVTVPAGNNLILGSTLTVFGGSLTFENNASLLQVNDNAVNSGDIIYKRSNTSAREEDYTYWSSPVAGQKLIDVSPLTPSSYFFSFDPVAYNWIQENTNNSMGSGIGYIIRNPHYPPGPSPPGFYVAPFKGVPNNGIKTITNIVADAAYLLGNPYPSALDADKFLQENANTLGGTLYFWTHNTAMQDRNLILSSAGSGAMAYTANDYATYNATGGVGAIDPGTVSGSAPSDPNNSILDPVTGLYVDQGTKPTGKIASGQGFFASSLVSPTTTTIVFSNAMRVAGTTLLNGTGANQQFFKRPSSKATTARAFEKHRIWLNLSNKQGAFKQTLVGYVTGATNENDRRFDGESFDGNEFVDFYSVNQNKNLVIQGRALPFDENDTVALGFRTTIDGTFTINIDEADGLLTNQVVFIEDKLTNTVFNLKSGNYTFTTFAGTFNDRFVLRYTNPSAKTLGTADFTAKENQVLVSNTRKEIKVNSYAETLDKVSVYDMAGKQLFLKTNVNSDEFLIPNLTGNHQVLVVKIVLQNGQAVSRKIIY